MVTRPDHRGKSLAAELVGAVLEHIRGPWTLEAQSHLREYYARFGFEVSGPEYIEDGIPHIPMRKDPVPGETDS